MFPLTWHAICCDSVVLFLPTNKHRKCTCILTSCLTGDMDGMKNSPANGPGTPRDDLPPVSGPDMGGYPNIGGYQDNVSLSLNAPVKSTADDIFVASHLHLEGM